VIGFEEKLATGREDALETIEELGIVDESVFVMPLLRPRIRAEQVES
tara:strand:+ start:1763 stop:1903 length:141 start_codon:yes stop_codon:yes gene_type:complete